MSVTRYSRTATEAEIEGAIRDAVPNISGRLWHVRGSRGQPVEDMPDMVLVVAVRGPAPGIVGLLETKSQRRNITPGQRHVQGLLDSYTRLLTGVVRPVPPTWRAVRR